MHNIHINESIHINISYKIDTTILRQMQILILFKRYLVKHLIMQNYFLLFYLKYYLKMKQMFD